MAGSCATVIQRSNPPYVVASFAKVWNSSAPCHCAGAGIVGCQAQVDVAAVTLHQLLEVANASIDVLFWVEWVDYI